MLYRKSKRTHSWKTRKRTSTFKAMLEALEERTLLAAFFPVLNLNDSGIGSLRQAILDANDTPGDDTITFDSSLSGGTITLVSGVLEITDDVEIQGLGARNLTVSGNNQSGVFQLDDGDHINDIAVSISGLTITGGNRHGISNSESLSLTSSVISRNSSAVRGGGIFSDGSLTVTDSTISGNSTDGDGGGISSRDFLIITNSTVSGNSARFRGGGIEIEHNQITTTTIRDCTINGNSTSNFGGGVSNGGNLTVTGSTISGNVSSRYGGGILNIGGYGGGQLLTITNSTVSGNSASTGGGVHNRAGRIDLVNTIVANSPSGGDVAGSVNLAGRNIVEDGSITGPDVLNVDPRLGPLQDNGGPTVTHALLSGSPAIDTGVNGLALDSDGDPLMNDQRGSPFVRTFDGSGDGIATVDIGAFEWQTVPLHLVVDSLVDESDGDYSDGDRSLREMIGLTNGSVGANTVTFDNSLSDGTIVLTGGELTIRDDVEIQGLGAGSLAVSGNNQSRVFTVDDGDIRHTIDVSLSGLTIMGGYASGSLPDNRGGGIDNRESLSITDSIISGNLAGRGGGIFNYRELWLTGSIVSDNSASLGPIGLGGGIFNSSKSSASIANSTVSGNSADDGGGVFNEFHSTVSLSGTTVSGNSASADGGGIFNDSPLSLTGSTVSGNTASERGGGIAANGHVTVDNSIVAGNSDNGTAPDLHANAGTPSVRFSLIGDNVGTGLAESQTPDDNGNLIGNPGGDGTIAPLLGPLENYGGPTQTHALLPDSPAINVGDPDFTEPPHHDQRGAPFNRLAGGRIDMGAFETQLAPVDFVADGELNGSDVDALVAAIAGEDSPLDFDLTGDELVNQDDLDVWLRLAGLENLPSHGPFAPGDGNLDGVVDGMDFNTWNSHKFTQTAAWRLADFNADGVTDGSDFNLWKDNRFGVSAGQLAAATRGQSAKRSPRAALATSRSEFVLAVDAIFSRSRIGNDGGLFSVPVVVDFELRDAPTRVTALTKRSLGEGPASDDSHARSSWESDALFRPRPVPFRWLPLDRQTAEASADELFEDLGMDWEAVDEFFR